MTAPARAPATGLTQVTLGDGSAYPDLLAEAYLAFAAVAPVSLQVRAAVERVLASYASQGNAAVPTWIEQRARLRERLARLVGASADDLALTSGTTRGLVDLAHCFPWQSGDKVVLFSGEFPANVAPWLRAAELFSLEPRFISLERAVEDAGSFLEPLEGQLRRGVRLVAVSAVQFQTGFRMPLAEIGSLCARYGAELCVDAIQACGVMPLDVNALGIDYLACGAHKWLLGIEGAGFLYAKPERARALVPRSAGWLSHEGGDRFLFAGKGELRYDLPLRRNIGFMEGSSPNTLGLAAFEAALEPLFSLTPAAIYAHVQPYLDALETGLASLGLRSLRSPRAGERSAILSVDPGADVPASQLVSALRARKVWASAPDGLLRFAPHYANRHEEVPFVVAAVSDALAELARPR